MVKPAPPMQGAQVRFLVRELRSHMPHDVAEKKKRERETKTDERNDSKAQIQFVAELDRSRWSHSRALFFLSFHSFSSRSRNLGVYVTLFANKTSLHILLWIFSFPTPSFQTSSFFLSI